MKNDPLTIKDHLPLEDPDHSKIYLSLSFLMAIYGVFTKLSLGYICPICLILTPLLFCIGVWLKEPDMR